MRHLLFSLAYLFILTNSPGQVPPAKRVTPSHSPLLFPPEQFHFANHLGDRINDCIERGIKSRDIGELVAPFSSRTESHLWQSEFWGKWMLSAAAAYRYKNDTALLAVMKRSVAELIKTQSKDGYIGNYSSEARLKEWDVWGSKYTLLGLLSYYEITKDNRALTSARSLADNVLNLIGPDKANIVTTGNYRGMPSSSILEPIVLLYSVTGEARYLDFAKYIVSQWETPDGPQLISKALKKVPVSERFTEMKQWWGWENGQKAYEMMSCYDGLLKLYQFTGDENYLKAVIAVVKNIREEEINVVGSGSAFECWHKGKSKQAMPTLRGMETCVTTTWIKLCYELYRLTGDPGLVEEIEKSASNHLLGALMPTGDRFSKYSGLQGYRTPDSYQCGMNINCCMANGPRGLLLLPDAAVMTDNQTAYVNFYNPGKGKLKIGKRVVGLEIGGRYPEKDTVKLRLDPETELSFDINLRIPSWSQGTQVWINNQKFSEPIQAGAYLKLHRLWKKGDAITLVFNIKGGVVTLRDGQQDYLAFTWGPLVLALDNRYNTVGMELSLPNDATVIKNFESIPPPPGSWIGFTSTVLYSFGEESKPVSITLVDFSSAGNGWNPENRYRVWIPVDYDAIRRLKD